MSESYEEERQKLLDYLGDTQRNGRSGKLEELRTTPLLSLQVRHNIDGLNKPDDDAQDLSGPDNNVVAHPSMLGKSDALGEPSTDNSYFPQYSLLGFHTGSHSDISVNEPILQNTRVPASTFICGSQGSGKSYTLSCMLENCLQLDAQTGRSGERVAGVVFHYDVDSESLPSESAGLCSLGIKTRVLVSPTNFQALKGKYENMAGAKANIEVVPLYFHSRHLTVERMVKLMAVVEGDTSVPLYMNVIFRILRDMAVSQHGKPFNFAMFKRQFMAPTQKHPDVFSHLEPGTLTIVDMNCPFVDAATARLLFDISLGLFKAHRPKSGLVVALDEAHKFMDDTTVTSTFTSSLLTTIREQRHVATRMIIATQEPTISTKLLDLCNVSIVHRFTSPAWYAAIKGHLGSAAFQGQGQEHPEDDGLLARIMKLEIGESLVFAPSAYVVSKDGKSCKLLEGVLRMKTRKRISQDQGLSKLADD